MKVCILLLCVAGALGSFTQLAKQQRGYGSCTDRGMSGSCVPTSECAHDTKSGLCPGGSDIQCCIDYGTCAGGGQCMAKSRCSGTSVGFLCPGPSNIQCCREDGGNNNRGGNGGNSDVSGDYVSGTEVPEAGLALIKEFEGCYLNAYPDPLSGNLPITIGWGSTRKLDGSRFRLGERISQQEADNLLVHQLVNSYLPPLKKIPVWSELNVYQQGAILSFAYNLGPHFYGHRNFATITRTLRNKNWGDIRRALTLYVNPGSNVEAGLRRRRNAEADLFLQ